MDWTLINAFSAWFFSGFRRRQTGVGHMRALEIGMTAPRPWWDERHLNNPPGVDPPHSLDFTDLHATGWRSQDH
jgi:hypothetical protein